MFMFSMDWKPIETAPFDRDVELAVIDGSGVHALTFACRRLFGGWMNAESKKRVYYLSPTHWRDRSLELSVSAARSEAPGAGARALTQRLAAIRRNASRVSNP